MNIAKRKKLLKRAAYILNKQRYDSGLGIKAIHRGRRWQQQWISCEKAAVLGAAMYERYKFRPDGYMHIDVDINTPLEEVRRVACMTPCQCHPSLTADELLEMMYSNDV